MNPNSNQQWVSDNLKRVNDRIDKACQQYGRDRSAVRLLAVSKTKPLEAVQAAMAAGQQHFGENYLQDAVLKATSMTQASWHFIGHIQSNKTRDIAQHFDWIHTIASAKVARRLSEQRPPERGPIKALIQVNISQEANKSGVSADEAAELAAFCATCHNLVPVGLMAIPAKQTAETGQRQAFHQLAQLSQAIRRQTELKEFTELSMGMSADLEAAIAEGATWVRIGTDIFGARDQ